MKLRESLFHCLDIKDTEIMIYLYHIFSNLTLLHTNFELLELKAEMLRTLGHPIRLSIIEQLILKEKLAVTEIYTILEIEQAVTSHHLRIMKNARIVKSSKSGKNVFYSLADDSIKLIFEALLK